MDDLELAKRIAYLLDRADRALTEQRQLEPPKLSSPVLQINPRAPKAFEQPTTTQAGSEWTETEEVRLRAAYQAASPGRRTQAFLASVLEE